MNNLLTRSLTGVFFCLVLILSIYFGKYSLIALFFIVMVLGLWEFYALSEKGSIKPQKILGVFAASVFYLVSTLYLNRMIPGQYLIIPIPLFFLIFIFELFSNPNLPAYRTGRPEGRPDKPLVNIAITLSGIFYIALPLALLSYLAYPPPPYPGFELYKYNSNVLLGFFFLIWTNDSAAYLTGVKFGKHKLFERISPKKTWEGSIGGAVSSLIVAYIISIYFTELQLTDWLAIAVIIIIFGTLGDLVQSLFKRSINVKDSGSILPGHGGILDRFDGVLLSVPFVFFYLQLIRFYR